MNIMRKLILPVLISAVILASCPVAPQSAAAESTERVIRVGWYESPFNHTDEYERRSGYGYEYQQMIAAYTGWTYEYVKGSWPNLMEMLKSGKIDLLSDVSYTEERKDQMLFSTLPMGSEDYYIFVAPDNTTISTSDYSTFNGKKVGVNKGSVIVDMLKDWAATHGVTFEIVEMTEALDVSFDMLNRGKLDMYVTLESYIGYSFAEPICKIGSSDIFFAVSNSCPDVLDELNAAINRIQSENPLYNRQLANKYISKAAITTYLNTDEKAWIAEHTTIRVGYQDNYLAFCAKDPKTGELTGALKDYLEMASDCLENAHLDFEAVAYPTASAALEALENGEVDCMFPANLTAYDGESQGYLVTLPLMRTDISAIVRKDEQKNFLKRDRIAVAVNAGNPNYNMFLVDNFPDWRALYFEDTPACIKAIADGKADCLLLSNYRYNNVSKLCDKYNLVSISTGVSMDYSFVVNRKNNTLYSILNKVTEAVPDASVHASLSYYFTEDAKMSAADFINQNIILVVLIIVLVAIIISTLVWLIVRARKRAALHKNLIEATETDEMTGLYTKNFFFEYANRMYRFDSTRQMDAIVINIEQFHSVNALYGREFGDKVIKELGAELLSIATETGGIASHSMSDHFALYCPHTGDYRALFERLQGRMDRLAKNASIRLRMGVMPYQAGVEPQQMIEHALWACNTVRGRFNEHLIVIDDKALEREAYLQRLQNDLHTAIENEEFEVYYQPKYDITTDEPTLAGMEALVRWRHMEFGMVSPADFIPLFERNGQIVLLDAYVREHAIAQVAKWYYKFETLIPVSVNLSRVEVFDTDLAKSLDELIDRYGIPRNAVRLEVTESAYIENTDQFITVIDSLRKKGYQIEMDDFGSGYSSLNMISSLPIDVLKMDRVFIRDIEFNDRNLKLVELILEIGKNLKMPIIAEGVETEGQLKLLKDMGCEYVQGFYFSRPLPAEEFEQKILGGV